MPCTTSMHVYVYIYTYMCMCVYTCVFLSVDFKKQVINQKKKSL